MHVIKVHFPRRKEFFLFKFQFGNERKGLSFIWSESYVSTRGWRAVRVCYQEVLGERGMVICHFSLLISLGVKPSRFFRVVANNRISSFLKAA